MKEHAETVHSDHVPESHSWILRLEQSRQQCRQRTDQCNRTESALTAALVHQWVEQHYDHAKNRQHNFRQNPDIIRGMGNDLRAVIHRPTTLLASCENGANTL